jgi:hypothetical protein
MLPDQLVLRTEQPFAKPLRECDGKPVPQGSSLSSIVRHGLHDGPAEVDFHQKPTTRVASSGDRIDSIRIHGMLWLLALLAITDLEPFPQRKIAKSRPDTPDNSKIPKCDFAPEADVAGVTTTINGSDPVINSAFYRPEVSLIASV